VGRNPNLTDRTLIWKVLLNRHTNPLIGTGYGSFWLDPRLDRLWEQKEAAGLNEAHNGYLGVYLNLGIIGLSLLTAFLISSYRTICKRLPPFRASPQ
jgi:exopolysaccharide production protein ExoQ